MESLNMCLGRSLMELQRTHRVRALPEIRATRRRRRSRSPHISQEITKVPGTRSTQTRREAFVYEGHFFSEGRRFELSGNVAYSRPLILTVLTIIFFAEEDDTFEGNVPGGMEGWKEGLKGLGFPPYDHGSPSLQHSSTVHSIPLLFIIPTHTFLVVAAVSWTLLGFLLLRKFVYCNLLYIS